MSLDTLLEAARYLELQEQKARQQVKVQQLQIHHQHHHHAAPGHHPLVAAAAAAPQHNNHHAVTVKVEPKVEIPAAPLPPSLPSTATVLHTTTTVVTPQLAAVHHQPQHIPGTTQVVQNGVIHATITNGPSVVSAGAPGHQDIPALIIDEAAVQHHHVQQQHPDKQHLQQLAVGQARRAQLLGRDHIPCVMRSGTREVHNKLEKHRRAHLKECFDMLKKQLPLQPDEKKTSNLSILHSALRFIQVLKRKERELEHEMERLAREKIAAQQRLATLKKEFASQCDNIDFSALLPSEADSGPATATPSTPSTVAGVTRIVTADAGSLTVNHSGSSQVMAVPQVVVTSTAPQTATVVAADTRGGAPQGLQTVSVLPVGYSHQGLVVGLHKVALVSKSLTPLVSSPVTHIITTPSQLNGKVVPLVNAQYLVKPVVVVSTPSVASTISPRPS